MTETEKSIVVRFKTSLEEKLRVSRVIVFGSRPRGHADEYSDLDVMVVLDEELTDSVSDYVSDCALHAGLGEGFLVVPVVFSRLDWQIRAVRD